MKLTITQKNQIIDKVDNFIEDLSIEELSVVNKVVVERIKYLRKATALFEMAKFRMGDIVSFQSEGRLITGKIFKFNQKTISVMTEDEEQWNVSPRMLMKKA